MPAWYWALHQTGRRTRVLAGHKTAGALVAEVVAGVPPPGRLNTSTLSTAINGQAVEAPMTTRKVASVPTGQTAIFSVARQGKPMQIKVAIGTRPENPQLASLSPKDGMMAPSSANAAGLGLSSLTPESKKSFNIAENVVAGAVITKVDPDSDAADKGLQPGDVVLRVGNRIVRSPADFQVGVAEAKKGGRNNVLLGAHSQAARFFVAIASTSLCPRRGENSPPFSVHAN